MRRAALLLASIGCLCAAAKAFGDGKTAVRWVASVYSDSKGIGLRYPEGVACDDRQLWVADTGNARVLRYSYEQERVTAEAEFPLAKSAPIVVQASSTGEIYALDGRERRIVSWGATGEMRGGLVFRELPPPAKVVPRSFRIGKKDEIYVLDVFGGRVLVVGPDGHYVRQIRFPERFGFFSDLAVDSEGGVLLVDSVEAAVYYADAQADRFSALTGSLKDYMNFPTGLATDGEGRIYLVDQYGSGLAVIGRDGSFLGRQLGLGWKESRLYYPSQICISPEGNLFIADRNNSRVQFFRLVGGGS